jgi:hypothetical protein
MGLLMGVEIVYNLIFCEKINRKITYDITYNIHDKISIIKKEN